MPSSRSSVRGLSRELRVAVRPEETCEHMMRRVDRDTTVAVCRHLVGDVRSVNGGVNGAVDGGVGTLRGGRDARPEHAR